MTGTVCLNGQLVAAAHARVSVFDRGFLYGDGLFETVRAYRGQVFALDAHLERLRASADFFGIPMPPVDWQHTIAALLRRNRLLAGDASVRMTLTRGPARPGLLPPPRGRPTVLIAAAPIDPRIARAQRRGVKAMLLPFARDDVFGGHKLLNYVPAIVGRILAKPQGAFEAFYVHARERLSEGTTSNLFICRDGRLLTPRLRDGVLPGVTRRLVSELARAAHLALHERSLRVADLRSADEAFCTSSLIEVMPIVNVDDQRVGQGVPGPVTRWLQQRYRELVTCDPTADRTRAL